jgi:NADH:ubiquinone reductase (non-electrogenic)
MVRDLVKGLPGQAKFNNPERPAASKLGVDPYLRVIGARDMVALGDCSMMVGDRLPATAQVRGQEDGTGCCRQAA